MTVTKIRFFLLAALLVAAPFVLYKACWLLRSRRVEGVFSFVGHGQAGDQVRLDYSVCWFPLGKDTIWFNGAGNLPFHEGEPIPVRYQVDDPGDARVDVFAAIWGDTVVYGGIPLFVLLMMWLHPQVVPRGKEVRITWKRPFIVLV